MLRSTKASFRYTKIKIGAMAKDAFCCCWWGRAPGVLVGGTSEHQHLLGVDREDSEWCEGLPKVCCWRTSRFGHLCSQCANVCCSSLHSGHEGSFAVSSRLAYALRGSVCPDRRRARRKASVLIEMAMQSAF